MTFEEYREVIMNGERVDWHGEMVPEILITGRVRFISDMVIESLAKLENEISDLRKGCKERESKERYLSILWTNIKHLPYSSNGLISDCYMIKYKRIVSEMEEMESKKPKPKTQKTRKPKISTTTKPKEDTSKVKEETTTPVVKGRRGKNNNLIFGNNN